MTPVEVGAWALCPHCRAYVSRLARRVIGGAPVRCPWCGGLATVAEWLEAGARDPCSCGCPRAAHVGYTTADGLAPRPGEPLRAKPAPCIAHGCITVSGAGEVRAQ